MMKVFTYGTNVEKCFKLLEAELTEIFGEWGFKVVKSNDQYYMEYKPNGDANAKNYYTKIKLVRNGGGGMFASPWFNMSVHIEKHD